MIVPGLAIGVLAEATNFSSEWKRAPKRQGATGRLRA